MRMAWADLRSARQPWNQVREASHCAVLVRSQQRLTNEARQASFGDMDPRRRWLMIWRSPRVGAPTEVSRRCDHCCTLAIALVRCVAAVPAALITSHISQSPRSFPARVVGHPSAIDKIVTLLVLRDRCCLFIVRLCVFPCRPCSDRRNASDSRGPAGPCCVSRKRDRWQ